MYEKIEKLKFGKVVDCLLCGGSAFCASFLAFFGFFCTLGLAWVFSIDTFGI